MKTILCTGASGFLGSHISHKLIANGHHVVGIDDYSGGSRDNFASAYGDVCDSAIVESAFQLTPRIDAVVHCSAFASENLSHNCRVHTYRSIVQGTANLVNACVNHGVKCLISMSSIAVYGKQPAPFNETDYAVPAEPYGAAKLCAEYDLKSAHDNFGLNYVIFRPHNIIGTRQSLADSTRNVASIFIRQALEGKPLTIFGDGEQRRAFSPVSYVADVIAASVERHKTWDRTYNIGGDQIMSVNQLADMVEKAVGHPLERKHLPARNETVNAYSNHNWVDRHFPDIMRTETIQHCIEDMVEEARKRPLPEIKPLPRIEIQEKLNPAWIRS